MNNNYLKHYGILGMRWGRSKNKAQVQGAATVIRTRNSEDHDKKMALKTKKLNEMSNEELRTYTQRAALERQYKELSKNEISAGKKFVNKLVDSATKGATDMAVSYVNKRAAKMVEELIKKTVKETVK